MTNGTEGSRANPASWTRNGAPRSSRPRTRRGTDTAPFRPACHDSAQVHRVGDRRRPRSRARWRSGPALLRDLRQGEAPAEDARAEGHAHDESHLPTLISLQVFIGLKDIGDEVAPTFTLLTQHGASGASRRTRVRSSSSPFTTPSATTSARCSARRYNSRHTNSAQRQYGPFRDRQH